MTDLYEVVFEEVSMADVLPLVQYLVSKAGAITDAVCSEGGELLHEGSLASDALMVLLNDKAGFIAIFNLENMNVGNCALPLVLLRVVKYQNRYDVDFSFDLGGDAESAVSTMKRLHAWAMRIASRYKVENVFGGLELAADVETRYFVGESFNPPPHT